MKDTRFMSAREKELVLKQWVAFVKNGFQRKHFKNRLYQHLIMHCSYVAHYSLLGFYETYFENPEDTVKFLRQFDKDYGCVSAEYGGISWKNNPEYQDLNSAMCDAVEPYKEAIYAKCREEERSVDLYEAEALLKKHGYRLNLG